MFAILSASVLVGLSAPQELSDIQIKANVILFAGKVDVQASSELLVQRFASPVTSSSRIVEFSGSKIFALDKTGRYVIQYSDSKPNTGSVLPLTIESYKGKANNYALTLAYFQELTQPRSLTTEVEASTKTVQVSFYEKVNGIDIRGARNRMSFGFSTSTGKLVSFSASIGYTYSHRYVSISQSEAISLAKSYYRAMHGKDFTGSVSISLGYAPIASDFGTTTYQERKSAKRVYYCYIVQLGHSTVYVNATDGSSLGGVRGMIR